LHLNFENPLAFIIFSILDMPGIPPNGRILSVLLEMEEEAAAEVPLVPLLLLPLPAALAFN